MCSHAQCAPSSEQPPASVSWEHEGATPASGRLRQNRALSLQWHHGKAEQRSSVSCSEHSTARQYAPQAHPLSSAQLAWSEALTHNELAPRSQCSPGGDCGASPCLLRSLAMAGAPSSRGPSSTGSAATSGPGVIRFLSGISEAARDKSDLSVGISEATTHKSDLSDAASQAAGPQIRFLQCCLPGTACTNPVSLARLADRRPATGFRHACPRDPARPP